MLNFSRLKTLNYIMDMHVHESSSVIFFIKIRFCRVFMVKKLPGKRETLIRYFSKFLAIAIAYLVMIECTSQPEQHMNMVVFRVVDILIKLLY